MWIWIQRPEGAGAPGVVSTDTIETLREHPVQPSSRTNQTLWVESIKREYILAFVDKACEEGDLVVAACVCGDAGPMPPVCSACGETLLHDGSHSPDGPARLIRCGGTGDMLKLTTAQPLWKRRGLTEKQASVAVRALLDSIICDDDSGEACAVEMTLAINRVLDRWHGKVHVYDAMNAACTALVSLLTSNLEESTVIELFDAWLFISREVDKEEARKQLS